MKNNKKSKREIKKEIIIMDFENSKHIIWNKRRRFGI
jgi:hypothetical protein